MAACSSSLLIPLVFSGASSNYEYLWTVDYLIAYSPNALHIFFLNVSAALKPNLTHNKKILNCLGSPDILELH